MRSGINEFCALETIDQNEELIKMTLALMMAPDCPQPKADDGDRQKPAKNMHSLRMANRTHLHLAKPVNPLQTITFQCRDSSWRTFRIDDVKPANRSDWVKLNLFHARQPGEVFYCGGQSVLCILKLA